MHTKPLLKKDLLKRNKFATRERKSFSFWTYVFFRRDRKLFGLLYLLKIAIPLKRLLIGCGNALTGQAGEVVSQNYPNPYPAPYHCTWSIVIPRFYQILLHVVEYDIGPGNLNTDCRMTVNMQRKILISSGISAVWYAAGVAAVERLPVLYHSVDYISFPLGSLGPLWYIWKWSSAHVYARGRKQCCKLHFCLWRVSIKTRLPFSDL